MLNVRVEPEINQTYKEWQMKHKINTTLSDQIFLHIKWFGKKSSDTIQIINNVKTPLGITLLQAVQNFFASDRSTEVDYIDGYD